MVVAVSSSTSESRSISVDSKHCVADSRPLALGSSITDTCRLRQHSNTCLSQDGGFQPGPSKSCVLSDQKEGQPLEEQVIEVISYHVVALTLLLRIQLCGKTKEQGATGMRPKDIRSV